MGENKKDAGKNTGMLIGFIFWLGGILAILGSIRSSVSAVLYPEREFWFLYIYLSFFSLQVGLTSLTISTLFIKKSFFVDSKSLFCVTFKSSYYFTYFLGTTGYIAITLVNSSLLYRRSTGSGKIIRNISDVVIPFIFIATFILFQISFRRIHRLFLSKKQSNLEMNN